ncbi:MAG: pilin [Alcanivoracaceae bacterium]|nr:pilin [Alcanivoracaceae bacterium]
MIRKSALIILVSIVAFLSACDSTDKQQQIIQSQQIIENIQNVAWMREKLPAGTLAYVRIPTIWELLFEAKADVLHSLQKLDEHKSLINQFKGGIVETYSEFMPDEVHLPFKTLVRNMTTPLEMAVINASDGSMIPNSLFATTLKDTSIQDLTTIISTLIKQSDSQIKMIAPFNSQGQAQLMVVMVPVYISFDDDTGQLALFSGLTANTKELGMLLAQTQHAPELDDIFNYENSVDQTGKNIELWLNIKGIYQQNKGFIPENIKPMVAQMGLDKMEYLWAGTASANGKSEVVLRLAMPEVGFRQFMPRVDSRSNIRTAGLPRSVWQIALPTVEQIKQGFELALSFSGDKTKTKAEVNEVINKINNFLGVTLDEIYDVYDQKLLIVTDDSGTWLATKILDVSSHELILEKLGKAFKTKASRKKLAGVAINQSIFSTAAFEKEILRESKDNKVMEKLFSLKQYSYYQIENDYLLQAFTPQVLADRSNSHNKIELQDWLNRQQGVNWDNAIFAYSKEVKDAPRDIYYTYLSILTLLGEVAKVEIDLFSLPTAQQLKLPEKGRLGFSLDSAKDSFTLKLSYEYSLLESMSSSGSFMSIAVVGILAAIAIPAYRDYMVRAQVYDKIFSVSEEKLIIAEYYRKNNSFPNTGFSSQKFDESEELLYNPRNGQITIYFSEDSDSELRRKNIKITPSVETRGYIQWQCSGTVAEKYYQQACDH